MNCPQCSLKMDKVKGLKQDYQCPTHGIVWKDSNGWHWFETQELKEVI